jgi:hypothetical protein
MRLLVFRSAIPFAYLAFALGLVAISLLAMWLIVRAVRRRPHRGTAFVLPVMLLLAVALTIAANVREDALLDLNPIVASTSDLLGTWRDGSALLELRPDSSYRCNVPPNDRALCGTPTASGHWRRDGDFIVILEGSDHQQVKLRVIRYANVLRLTEEQDDPDMWSGRLGFHR